MFRKIFRILSGILGTALVVSYIDKSTTAGDRFEALGVVFFSIPFFMYALRGNNWPFALFKNVVKKNDGNDSYESFDYRWFIGLFKKKK